MLCFGLVGIFAHESASNILKLCCFASFITKPMGPNASTTISACVHKRHSEQSRAGVTDECFGVAAVGLEHLERLVPVDIRDLQQFRASAHRTRHEAGAQRMAAKRGRIKAETGSTLLHDLRDIPRR